MAIGADVGGIFFNILYTVGSFGLMAVILIAWVPAYFYAIKYRINITVRERVGNHTTTFQTRGGIVKNKKRGRSEFRILKSKINPFSYWEFPILSDKYYHQSRRGKKYLEFYKAGELSTDLKPIPPLSPMELNIVPTDIKIFDWTMQGFEKDARETRTETDKFTKYAMVGVPMILIAAVVMTVIMVMGTVEDLQAGNVQIASSLFVNLCPFTIVYFTSFRLRLFLFSLRFF